MVEDGTGENETISKGHRDADGNSRAYVAQHAARRGAVEINGVAAARIKRGDDVRLAVERKSNVADEAFVTNLVNRFSSVSAAMRLAHDTSTLGWRSGFGHEAPHGEAWRGAGRLAAAHLIYSRRQSGMSEEQLQVCYHALPNHRVSPAANSSRKCFQFGCRVHFG